MVFPLVADNIVEDSLIDYSPTDVNSEVFVIMTVLEQFCDLIN